jgi:hypothetical protein
MAATILVAALSILFDWSSWLKWGAFVFVLGSIAHFITSEVAGGPGNHSVFNQGDG